MSSMVFSSISSRVEGCFLDDLSFAIMGLLSFLTSWQIQQGFCASVLPLLFPFGQQFLSDDEKNTLRISEGIRGNPNMSVINESGLYAPSSF
jgi:hypothetical protein